MADSDAVPLVVNQRPVAAKSILRLGDHIRLGDVEMVLLGDSERPSSNAARRPAVALRSGSGPPHNPAASRQVEGGASRKR